MYNEHYYYYCYTCLFKFYPRNSYASVILVAFHIMIYIIRNIYYIIGFQLKDTWRMYKVNNLRVIIAFAGVICIYTFILVMQFDI